MLNWLLIIFLITCICGLVYIAVQQNYRQSANDPQIQMAEDTAALSTELHTYSPQQTVDVEKSLKPFIMVFNGKGDCIGSEAILGNKNPVIPSGVFGYVNSHGEDKITWEPKSGVRIAAVIVPYHQGTQTGFVLAGRNIREIEEREAQLERICLFVWVIGVLGTYVILSFGLFPRER